MNEPAQPAVTISLTVKDSSAALDFYGKAFGAVEHYRMPLPTGGIAHAEFSIGGTAIYISDEAEDWKAYAMPEGAMSSCVFSIGTDNCDDAFAKAVAAGADGLVPPTDQFYGMRTAVVKDPFGYRWSFAQITEQLTMEEIEARMKQLMG